MHNGGMSQTPASPKQISYIISLVSRIEGAHHSHLSQARHAIGLSSSKASRGLNKAEASAIITDLLKRT